MVSDPATGRTVTGFSMHVLLATLMGINKISLDFVSVLETLICISNRYRIMQPALSGNCFSLHKREVYSGPASLLPLRSSMLIKCTQLSIEVALAGILAQIYGGRP